MKTDMLAQRTRQMRSSDIREAFRLAEQPGVISFAGGFPTPASFPVDALNHVMTGLLQSKPELALQYGPTEGFSAIREAAADKMRSDGMMVDSGMIMMTNGSQQGIDLAAKILLDPGDVVLVEKPSYIGGLNAILAYEPQIVGIEIDQDGLNIEKLKKVLTDLVQAGKRIKFLYTVPNFQNPTGATLSFERRIQLLELAQEYEFFILEDNPYGDIYFGEPSPPPIRSLPGSEEYVVYFGSFSKFFLPGFRIGWVHAPQVLREKLAIAKQSTDLCTNSFGQLVAAEWYRSSDIQRHFENIRLQYRRKRDLAIEWLEMSMPEGVEWNKPSGGFFIWLRLPKGSDARKLLPYAVKEGVAFVPGGGFHGDGTGENTIRLSFSQPEPELIVEGIRRLGSVVHRFIGENRSRLAVI